jgi:UDP-GlcNAc:undecaprenyl-phosphate GlcNAc-1-phosphate transferase
MSRFIPIILGSALISFIATPLVRQVAQRAGFLDQPDPRKVHVSPTPLMGGVAIYIGFVAALLLAGARPTRELLGVVGGTTLLLGIGLWDDRRDIQPWIKLAGQVLAGGLLIWSGVQVTLFQQQWQNVVLTIFWVVGICNAINFLDNMDGLAAGTAAVASGFFFVLALVEELGLVASLAAAVLGACIAFLYYNFNPATLFMGDAGSLVLGFVLAVLGIKLEFAGRPLGATWMIPVIILGLPIFDTTLVVLSRIRRGKPIYQGGKDHTSHRLVQVFGMTPARSVMTLYMISIMLGLIALMLRDATTAQARLILAGLSLTFIFAMVWLEWNFINGPKASPSS